MDLCDINVIKVLLAKHGFSFSKGLGQNFLCCAHVPVSIAENAGIDEETGVLEVGPGIGTLTKELCARAKKVVAVELDKRLPPLLEDTLGQYKNFELVMGDILKTDIKVLVKEHFEGCTSVVACANLPYYITTPALSALIDSKVFDRITVMVQKEVALRMCAEAGSGDYGAFTPYIAFNTDARILFDVGRECFMPSPKVDSAVVSMEVLKTPPVSVSDEKLMFSVIKAAFGQRRKTLLNCLSSLGMPKDEVRDILNSCGISPSIRGERLDISDFAAISDAIHERR